MEQTSKKSGGFGGLFCCMMPAMANAAPVQEDAGIHTMLSSLEGMAGNEEEKQNFLFLKGILESDEFQSLLKVHETVTTPESEDYRPVYENTLQSVEEVSSILAKSHTTEALELHEILQNPHFQALLDCHDKVACKEFQPILPDIPFEVDEDEESVKIVRLVKGECEPLGATIHFDDSTGGIRIARVMHGGAADRSGLIQVGDEVHEVNGIKVVGKPPQEVMKILANAVGPIMLKLVPSVLDSSPRETKIHVRAHFTYNPLADNIIPCREAGLSFQRGDILHIVSQDDVMWWQARREGDKNMRAGLIPGKQLQERREMVRVAKGKGEANKENKDVKDTKATDKNKTKFSPKLGMKKTKKSKKIVYQSVPSEESEADEALSYEEVEKLSPRMEQPRPIVLIGAPGVGRNELKKRLLTSNEGHFKGAIPHTSRSKKSSEVDGEEYFYVSKGEMEREIQNKSLIEYGEYKGNFYGTSLEQIRSTINNGQVCVLCPHPQALKSLRVADLKPYIVFIKPPLFERLKETRTNMKAKSTFDEKSTRPFTDDEFREMIEASNRLENTYGHLFDLTVVNGDLQKTINELVLAAHKLETDAHWVPAQWIR